jgi:hypothetical protein
MANKEQQHIALKIKLMLEEKGYECELDNSSAVVDIIVEVGKLDKNPYTKGIFRVFWDEKPPFEIGYLQAGEPHSDGYEIRNKWQRPLPFNESLLTVLEKDVEALEKYHSKRIEFHKRMGWVK